MSDRTHSTQRVEAHRARVLARFAAAWDKCPDLSFAELVSRSVRAADPDALALLGLERFDDSRLVEVVAHYATMREIPTRPGKEPR